MKLASKLREYKRILLISKKPGKKEVETIIRVTGAGILVIGMIGFIIQLIYELIRG